jgi:DNA-directed RNA polymerase subunit RPC12/RpoP
MQVIITCYNCGAEINTKVPDVVGKAEYGTCSYCKHIVQIYLRTKDEINIDEVGSN